MPRLRPFATFLAASLAIGGCDALDREGMILLTDTAYRASMVATANDGIVKPDGLLWRDGRLYFADEGNASVSVRSNGEKPRMLASRRLGIATPEDIVMDGAGNLFFTDDGAGGVWQVDPSGRASLLAGKSKGLGPTEGIALAPTGDILVGDAEQHRIMRVGRDGAVSVFLGPERGVMKPESMAFDVAGNLFIADNEDDVLYLLGRDGTLQSLIRGREDFSPETIWYARGMLYITDSKNDKLYRYSAARGLETIAVFGGKLGYVSGVAGDGSDGLYVSIQAREEGKAGYIVHLARMPA